MEQYERKLLTSKHFSVLFASLSNGKYWSEHSSYQIFKTPNGPETIQNLEDLAELIQAFITSNILTMIAIKKQGFSPVMEYNLTETATEANPLVLYKLMTNTLKHCSPFAISKVHQHDFALIIALLQDRVLENLPDYKTAPEVIV